MPTGDALADTGATVGILVGIGSLLVMLWVWIGRPVRREWKLNREFQRQFRTDWMGVPDRDGVPGHPGVMSSLADLRTDARTAFDSPNVSARWSATYCGYAAKSLGYSLTGVRTRRTRHP